MRGPKAKPRTYIDTRKVAVIDEVLLNSRIIIGTAGANMDDPSGLSSYQCNSSASDAKAGRRT